MTAEERRLRERFRRTVRRRLSEAAWEGILEADDYFVVRKQEAENRLREAGI